MPDRQMDAMRLFLMVVIVHKGKGEKIGSLFSVQGATCNLLTLGRGTADKKMLSYLGLGETEKEILLSFVTGENARIMFRKLEDKLDLHKPDHGIAFTIPINGFSSAQAQKRFRGEGQQMEGATLEQSHACAVYPCDLIITIANQGYAADIMHAANAAGATGGTVLHARGIGLKEAEKFFGITIQPEKELILILARREERQAIMTAITTHHGLHTDTRAMSFSMPVSGVAGLNFLKPPGEEKK